MIHIFHHNDPDGWCSAAIVLKCLSIVSDEKRLHECRYGMEFPWDEIGKGDTVYMVDFSLEPMDMIRLGGQCRKLHWIDHHVSAIDKMADKYPDYILAMNGIQVVGRAACELTWDYLFEDKPMPRAVHLISMYDVWKLKEEPAALPFQYGIKTLRGISDPKNEMWDMLIDTDGRADHHTAELLHLGLVIQSYQDECNAQICRRAAFETKLTVRTDPDTTWTYNAIACTSPMCNSMLFDSVWDPAKHHIMLSFYWDAKGWWTVSVYTQKDDVDCSVIAKSFGGGGHRGASGWQCKELPFKLNKQGDM